LHRQVVVVDEQAGLHPGPVGSEIDADAVVPESVDVVSAMASPTRRLQSPSKTRTKSMRLVIIMGQPPPKVGASPMI